MVERVVSLFRTQDLIINLLALLLLSRELSCHSDYAARKAPATAMRRVDNCIWESFSTVQENRATTTRARKHRVYYKPDLQVDLPYCNYEILKHRLLRRCRAK